jgi:flagellin
MLSIQGNGGFSLHSMQQANDRLHDSMRKLASGKRIASAKDDAAGLAIAARLAAVEASLAQGSRNLADGQGLASTAEATLSSTSDDLDRMRELTVQAQNGTLSSSDRATIQQEYDQLAQEITRRSDSAAFGGQHLLDGSLSGSGAVTLHDGQGPSVRIDIDSQSADALGVAGLSVGSPGTLQALDQARDQVSRTRADLGAIDNRIGSEIATVGASREAIGAARSRIEDVDVAYESAQATRDRLLVDATVALAAQSRRASAATALRVLA